MILVFPLTALPRGQGRWPTSDLPYRPKSRYGPSRSVAPSMGRYSHQPGQTATTSETVRPLGERLRDDLHLDVLMPLQRILTALTVGLASFPGGLSVHCGCGKVPSGLLGTVVALEAHDESNALLGSSQTCSGTNSGDESAISRGILLGKLRRGETESDASTLAHRHKLAVFPHKLLNGNSGQREGDDGRDTNTTNAGPGQAELVRPLATATVCSVPGLRVEAGPGGEPGDPGSPGRVQLTTSPEGTEVEAQDLEALPYNSATIP